MLEAVNRAYLNLVEHSWPVYKRMLALHTVVYRASGGRIGHRFLHLKQTLLIDHVGARSGTHRTSGLVYAKDGANLILVASKGGHPRNPDWFHNLRANPDTTVQVGTERRTVHARVAQQDERERLWALAIDVHPGFAAYQARTDREIPLVVLEPRP
ncbi:conserved hypothetical protein (plasmid) [Rhodococcus jostii RHA1]|uniref:Deazaflavin-dependent oxidoreductase, nitroreductase family n=1 Tax=Rhodococcus jostii (strain RHA1) TaxID=101510 RepID=Q0RVI7_RHOJR|nr:nitroreductase family deazaflavin-dependent oxidoreductase [Rhodococcus jostii]ABH00699.1 conserved hypothetical protein [Rhodococcus jostii RHA1]